MHDPNYYLISSVLKCFWFYLIFLEEGGGRRLKTRIKGVEKYYSWLALYATNLDFVLGTRYGSPNPTRSAPEFRARSTHWAFLCIIHQQTNKQMKVTNSFKLNPFGNYKICVHYRAWKSIRGLTLRVHDLLVSFRTLKKVSIHSLAQMCYSMNWSQWAIKIINPLSIGDNPSKDPLTLGIMAIQRLILLCGHLHDHQEV